MTSEIFPLNLCYQNLDQNTTQSNGCNTIQFMCVVVLFRNLILQRQFYRIPMAINLIAIFVFAEKRERETNERKKIVFHSKQKQKIHMCKRAKFTLMTKTTVLWNHYECWF